jgi:hypothetical protein
MQPPVSSHQLWNERFKAIRDQERYLALNGTVVIKFMLNVSKEMQARRFLRRIDDPKRNWKFSSADMAERSHWPLYQQVRKTPSCPRSRANFSLLYLYSRRNAWANLHRLGQSNTFLAAVVRGSDQRHIAALGAMVCGPRRLQIVHEGAGLVYHRRHLGAAAAQNSHAECERKGEVLASTVAAGG